jgi:hypothetical protein
MIKISEHKIVEGVRQSKEMGIAGYISVCVQIYCMLVFTVFHYMFRPSWPSSSVQDSSYIYFHMLKDSASLPFSCSHTLHVFHLWGG